MARSPIRSRRRSGFRFWKSSPARKAARSFVAAMRLPAKPPPLKLSVRVALRSNRARRSIPPSWQNLSRNMVTSASPPSPDAANSRCAAELSICSRGRRRNHCGWSFSTRISNRSASSISIRRLRPQSCWSRICYSPSRRRRRPSLIIDGRRISSFRSARRSRNPTSASSKARRNLTARKMTRWPVTAVRWGPSRRGISCWRKRGGRISSASSTTGNATAGTSRWSSATGARKNDLPNWQEKIWSAISG